MAGIDALRAPPHDLGRHLFTVGPNANASTSLLARTERVIKELLGCKFVCAMLRSCVWRCNTSYTGLNCPGLNNRHGSEWPCHQMGRTETGDDKMGPHSGAQGSAGSGGRGGRLQDAAQGSAGVSPLLEPCYIARKRFQLELKSTL